MYNSEQQRAIVDPGELVSLHQRAVRDHLNPEVEFLFLFSYPTTADSLWSRIRGNGPPTNRCGRSTNYLRDLLPEFLPLGNYWRGGLIKNLDCVNTISTAARLAIRYAQDEIESDRYKRMLRRNFNPALTLQVSNLKRTNEKYQET